MSDSHTYHNSIEKDWMREADTICHSGDICLLGAHKEALDFLEWFSSLPYENKIFTLGNHDICFDEKHHRFEKFRKGHKFHYKEYINDIRDKIPENIILLENSGVTVDGINFWGYPQSPEFFNWAFNVKRGEQMSFYTDKIPDDTDVLLTHGPPFNILDKTINGEIVGCKELLDRVNVVKPIICSFGHIHESYGVLEKDETLFLNSSLLNLKYWVVNKPHLVEIDKDKKVKIIYNEQ